MQIVLLQKGIAGHRDESIRQELFHERLFRLADELPPAGPEFTEPGEAEFRRRKDARLAQGKL
jgi:hypothetical protein